MKKILLFISVYFLLNLSVHAQNSKDEVVRLYLKLGKELIRQQRYDSAVTVLSAAFIKDVILPDEILYYYGYALYKNNDLKQGKKMLEKFLALTHTHDDLYKSAAQLVDEINKKIDSTLKVCNDCKGKGYLLIDCTTCHHTGQLVCDICEGTGKVLIGVNTGMKIGTCTKCKGNGSVVCPVCEGTGKKKEICVFCKGKGKK